MFFNGVVPSVVLANFWYPSGGNPAAELDSRLLPSEGLTHQRNCELETLREESLQWSKGSEWGWNPQWRESVGWHLCSAIGRRKLSGVQKPMNEGEEG